MEALVAAARAAGAPSATDDVAVGDAGARSPGDAGGVLTNRALLARSDKNTAEHVSNTFVIAPSAGSSVAVSIDANALSSIERAVSERPDSFDLSSSFSRSVDEVECRSFLERGERCCGNPTKCDCGACALAARNAEYFQGLRAGQESEARMLDADVWGKRIKDLGETNIPTRERISEAQKHREFEHEGRLVTSKSQRYPPSTMT
jgi:hypothetical protein